MKAEGITDEVRGLIDKALCERADHHDKNPETCENETGKTCCRQNAARFIAQAQQLRNRERLRRLAERAKWRAEREALLPNIAAYAAHHNPQKP